MPDDAVVRRASTGKLDSVRGSDQVTIMSKVDVNGPNAHEVFHFLKYNSSLYSEKKGVITPIPWNFSKFLVDARGGVIKYYGPKASPVDILPDIKAALEAPEGEPPRVMRVPTI